MTTGFYIMATFKNKTEVFVETEQTKRTKKLAEKVLNGLNENGITNNVEATENNLEWIIQRLRPAHLEIQHYSCGDCYDIQGENFGGYGNFLDGRDGKTVIIQDNLEKSLDITMLLCYNTISK